MITEKQYDQMLQDATDVLKSFKLSMEWQVSKLELGGVGLDVNLGRNELRMEGVLSLMSVAAKWNLEFTIESHLDELVIMMESRCFDEHAIDPDMAVQLKSHFGLHKKGSFEHQMHTLFSKIVEHHEDANPPVKAED